MGLFSGTHVGNKKRADSFCFLVDAHHTLFTDKKSRSLPAKKPNDNQASKIGKAKLPLPDPGCQRFLNKKLASDVD